LQRLRENLLLRKRRPLQLMLQSQRTPILVVDVTAAVVVVDVVAANQDQMPPVAKTNYRMEQKRTNHLKMAQKVQPTVAVVVVAQRVKV
jgi:hypothetical protein